MSKVVYKYQKDHVMLELLSCGGDAGLVLKKLDELSLYGCDFTLEEIGDILCITRERVRQIEATALKKLRHPKIGRAIKDYMDGIFPARLQAAITDTI